MDVTSVNYAVPAVPTGADPPNPKWLVENRELIRSVKSINASELFGQDSELTFAMDRETRRPVVRVVDRQTHDVLWQAPPEYLLRLAQAVGLSGR